MRLFTWDVSRVNEDSLTYELNVRQGTGWYPYKMTAEYAISPHDEYQKTVVAYHIIWKRHINTSEEILVEARQAVGRIWTEEKHKSKTFDPDLAESMAQLLRVYM